MRRDDEIEEQLIILTRRMGELARVVTTAPQGSAEWMQAARQAELAGLLALALNWAKGDVDTDSFESFLRGWTGA